MEIILIGNESDSKTLSSLINEEFGIQSLEISYQDILLKNFSQKTDQIFILAARKIDFQLVIRAIEHIKIQKPSAYIILLAEDKDMDLMGIALEYGINNFWVLTVITEGLRGKLIDQLKKIVGEKHTKRILAIGAHPDDVEIGCGGTMLKHVSNNDEIQILTLTRGAVGGDKEKRFLEASAAAEFLDARLIISNLQDTYVSDGSKTIRLIEEVIYNFQPDIIYTHSISDNHQDHRNTHLATIVAARKIDQIYAYQAPSTNISFHPQRFESIDNFMDSKIKLIAFHETQKNKAIYLKDEIIRANAIYWGRYANYKLVEPFEIIKS